MRDFGRDEDELWDSLCSLGISVDGVWHKQWIAHQRIYIKGELDH